MIKKVVVMVLILTVAMFSAGFIREHDSLHTNYSIDMTLVASKIFETRTDNILEQLIENKKEEIKIKEEEKIRLEKERLAKIEQNKAKETAKVSTYSRLNQESLILLQKIVMAEAGAESYEGQLAVANVVLNRLNHRNYPNTIKGVVFQRGQFTPAMRGTLWSAEPTSSVKRAVNEALNGKRAVGKDVLFFLNPRLATDFTIPNSKTLVRTIGNHSFYK